MKALKLTRSFLIIVLMLLIFTFVAPVGAHGPPWPIIDGFFESLWESGEPFTLWRGGDLTKSADGRGWALWDKGLPENAPRDLYVAIQMDSPITNTDLEENWIKANDKNGPILVFEEFAWFNGSGEPIGWEARVEVPAGVCALYIHTVIGEDETSAGLVDFCDPTAITLSSLRANFWPVAVVPALLTVSLVAVVVCQSRQRRLLC